MKDSLLKLLLRKLTGELNDKQKDEVNSLISKDDRVRDEYESIKHIWSDMDQYSHRKAIDDYQVKDYAIVRYLVYGAAAVLILFFAITSIYRKNVVLENNSNVLCSYTLPDSTNVILDKGAKLSYRVTLFGKFDRHVNFQGRGYFHVKKKDGEKFVVSCKDINIEVLGTKFDVSTDTGNTLITLEEGRIKLFDIKGLTDSSVILRPAQQAIYYGDKQKLIVRNVNPEVYSLWKEQRIYFDKFSIEDISQIIRLYYNKVLVFDDSSIVKRHIGGSAPSDDYMLILKALSIITESEYYISNDTIYFKHKQN